MLAARKANAEEVDFERVIVFLSDGNLDSTEQIGTAEEQQKKLFEEVVPSLKERGIKVYTLSFSEQANTKLLEELAVATGGEHWFTPTSEKIHESFANLFVAVKKPQMVPLTSKGFRIDKEIQEATFYINRQEGEEIALLSPGGEKFSINTKKKGFRWFPGQQFDVITIEEPEHGQWQISGIPKNEGFATVLTNLKLDTAWPAIVRAGDVQVLEARLYESIKPVVLPEMTDVIKYAFQITPTDKVSEPVLRGILSDDGENGDRIARDGIFSAKVSLDQSGEYKLRVLASGPTFERHQKLSFRVKPRLVSLQIVPAEQSISAKDNPDSKLSLSKDFFQLEISPELIGSKRLQVDLYATDQRRRRYKVPITRMSDSHYEAASLKLHHEGEYQLHATVSAEGRRKRKFRGRSQERVYLKEQVVDAQGNVVSVTLVDESKPKEKPKGFPWIYLVMLVAANGGLGYACMNKLKGVQSSMSDEAEEVFADVGPFEEALASLQARSEAAEIDFEDPIFTDESIELAPDLDITLSDPDAAPEEAAPPPPPPGDAEGGDEAQEESVEDSEAAGEETPEEESLDEEKEE